MPTYKEFERFELDPKNEREVLELAVQRAYQASGGELSAFNAGTPLMVLLEALVFSHMEFLHWLNQLPEAMILTNIAEVLGAKRNLGSYCNAQLRVDLTADLKTDFVLYAGTIIYSNKNSNKYYELTDTLVIPAGQLFGFINVQAYKTGPELAVEPNELTILQENFAYVAGVTNPAASTVGSGFETLEEVRQRVQTLMSQRTPVSMTDWRNLMDLTFPGKINLARVEDSVLSLYIQDYTTNPTFETFVAQVKGVLQKVIIEPYLRTDIDVIIRSDIDFNPSQVLEISQRMSRFLVDYLDRKVQPIDIYQDFANTYLFSSDISGFEVYYYPNTINPTILNLPSFNAFDYLGGQLTRDLNGNYWTSTSNFNVINGANDEAAIGNLEFHPIYNGNGEYTAGDIVKVSGTYYLINSSGPLQVGTTTNYTALSAPVAWNPNTAYTPSDFILEYSSYANISFGYIPAFNYTSEGALQNNFTSIIPVIKTIGQSVNVGEYWFFAGAEEVIYYNSTSALLTITAANFAQYQAVISEHPDQAFSHLTRYSRYRVGQITEDQNYIIIDSLGNRQPIPTGVALPGTIEYQSDFGALIEDSGVVYEVVEAFVPLSTDTIATLLQNGYIRRAYRRYDDFEVLNYTAYKPSYFDINTVKFIQPNPLTVTKAVGGTYSVV